LLIFPELFTPIQALIILRKPSELSKLGAKFIKQFKILINNLDAARVNKGFYWG